MNKKQKDKPVAAERTESDLPFASEFSPSQVDLPALLRIAHAHPGDRKAMQAAILARFFSSHGGKGSDASKSQRTLAMNCRLGMDNYGLLDSDGALTVLGQTLYGLRTDKPALYGALAKHILLNLNGMRLIECIREMVGAGEEVNLTTLREGLAERGVHYPRGGTHPSKMRLWLATAGVFVGSRWQIDEIKLGEVLGADPAQFGVLAAFTTEQRAFLRALANTGIKTPQPSNEIAELAAATYGVKFPEKSLPKLVLDSLEAAGYITKTKTTSGRGAKPFLVAPTAKLDADLIEPLLEQLKSQLDNKLLDLLRKPLANILTELDSTDRYIAGLALEALVFKLMRLVDMTYVATRLRAKDTGGAEVDLIFESARLVFSRWQVQCKNTARVSLDDVAKEVGLTHFMKSNVIVMVSTGEIGSEARRYANKIMRDSNLCIVMIDKGDLIAIRDKPAFVVQAFMREAAYAMTLKKLNLQEGA